MKVSITAGWSDTQIINKAKVPKSVSLITSYVIGQL